MIPRSPLTRIALALGVFAFAGGVRAQGVNDYGSVYSRFALGERAEFGSPAAAAMGGAGAVSFGSALALGMDNPALAADLVLTGFIASADVRGLSAEDRFGETASATAGGIAALAFGVPLLEGRAGLTLALTPYTRVNYRVIESDSVDVIGGGRQAYRLNYEGGGGLYRFRAGLGARPAGRLRVGASADVYFGRVEYGQRTEFPGSPTLEEVQVGRTTRLAGVSATVGAAYRAPAGENRALHLGAAVSLPARLSGSRIRTLGVNLDQDTLSAAQEGSATIPLSARAGAALAGQRWTFALEGLYEPWSGFESDFDWGGYDTATGAASLNDRYRISGGVQFLPGGGNRDAGFFGRTAFRLGAYTERAVAGPGGRTIPTAALTAGLSLPTLFPAARLDLGLEAGTRGATDDVLVRDRFVRGTFTITFGERWFVRRRIG